MFSAHFVKWSLLENQPGNNIRSDSYLGHLFFVLHTLLIWAPLLNNPVGHHIEGQN